MTFIGKITYLNILMSPWQASLNSYLEENLLAKKWYWNEISLGKSWLNPFATDIVFFVLYSCSRVSEDQFLTWWPILTIERFEKFKMAAGGHIGKMKNVRITNDTIFNMFLGSRNRIKMFVLWSEVKFSLQGHLKVI